MGLLVVQETAGVAVGAPTLATAERPLLVCGYWAWASRTALGVLSWGSGGLRWVLLGFFFTWKSHLTLWLGSRGALGFLTLMEVLGRDWLEAGELQGDLEGLGSRVSVALSSCGA